MTEVAPAHTVERDCLCVELDRVLVELNVGGREHGIELTGEAAHDLDLGGEILAAGHLFFGEPHEERLDEHERGRRIPTQRLE